MNFFRLYPVIMIAVILSGCTESKQDIKDNDRLSSNLNFPKDIIEFNNFTDIQRKSFNETNIDKNISGVGELLNIEKCNLSNSSKYYYLNCFEVFIQNEKMLAIVYINEADKDKLLELNKGSTFEFKDCKKLKL